MPTQKVCVALALSFVILFSCNRKKIKTYSAVVSTPNEIDISSTLPDRAISMQDYSNAFIKEVTQIFTAAQKKITVIIAKKGLRVTVNPAILEKQDGTKVDGKITVNIVELTTSDELFRSNAATVSNGRLLASGGSYFIGMECKGQQLRIKKGKSLQVEFPQISKDEMQLFYGQRDAENNMNWISAGMMLNKKKEEVAELQFTDSNRYSGMDRLPAFALTASGEAKIYPTLNEKVYYYETMMTIRELVDTINKNTAKIYIDTVSMWPKQTTKLLPGQWIDTNYLYRVYGPSKQFILKFCKAVEEEKERKAIEKMKRQQAIDNWQPQTLAGQVQKYYSPSAITNLGWINCDRLYQYNQQTEIELDLPITFIDGSLQYFVIFRSFNGLVNGKINYTNDKKVQLGNLPFNELVTLVAFTKNNGRLFQCKSEFTVEKKQSIKLDFKDISIEEMTKIFGKNVRI